MQNDPKKQAKASPVDEQGYGLSDEQSKEMLQALEQRDSSKMKALLDSLHVADVADFVHSISSEKRRQFIKMTGAQMDPAILVEFNQGTTSDAIDVLGPEKIAQIIKKLDTDDAVDVLEGLSTSGQQEILDAMPKKHREELERALAYPKDSAGRLMDKNVVSVPEFWTVGQAIDFLRSEQDLPEEFYQIFIADPKMKPIGGALLSRVIRAQRWVKMMDIMTPDPKLIYSEMDQEEVAFIFRQYGLASAPVVDGDGRMIGVITVDDIVEVMEEEAQEDIMHLGGISGTDFHSGYVATLRRRFPWLVTNLATAILASYVIAMFEGTITKLATLAVLMPIVASMGGNAGTQTITVIVRAIATKQLTTSNALRVVRKEMFVGLLNGVVFALITGVITYFWYGNLYMSIILGIASVLTMLLAGLTGALIPLGLEKLGVDPAIASSVVLTTITDISAFGVFLGIATLVLM